MQRNSRCGPLYKASISSVGGTDTLPISSSNETNSAPFPPACSPAADSLQSISSDSCAISSEASLHRAHKGPILLGSLSKKEFHQVQIVENHNFQ
ncbi:hypothetical protein RJT34_30665 [Clitoria ternatea]|uniref:Uncharacterized protein n=1 Tax=Clitoria ternatea TaxID=43366 RepID=A0AAN9I7L2_CLITE